MNPNLVIFLKRFLIFILIAGLCFAVYYIIQTYTQFDLEKLGTYIMYGFFGLVMAFMMVLIIGVTFKSVWINIMRRSDNIDVCCPDKHHDGIHIIGRHYFSGGELSDGYTAYHHYYITLSEGRMFLSKKIESEKDFTRSLHELSVKTKLDLHPDVSRAINVGPNTDRDDRPRTCDLKLANGNVRITGFDNLVDFGFRIVYSQDNKVRWRKVL